MRWLGSLGCGLALAALGCGGEGFSDQPPAGVDASSDGSAGAAGETGTPDAPDAPSCPTGKADCDGNAANGCETDITTTVAHCGKCGNACASGFNGEAVCDKGVCSLKCATDFLDCDKDAANGCETASISDPMNCGACKNSCTAPPHASPLCKTKVCSFECDAKFADCDKQEGNGCEADLDHAAETCGSCTNACTAPDNATAACTAGVCGWTCKGGWGDCDGNAGNGCETDTATTTTHCGSCNAACSTAHGTAQCEAGTCKIECESGYADCDAVNSNGCESQPLSDQKNCGFCGHDCGAEACTSGLCAPTNLGNSLVLVSSMTQYLTELYYTADGTTNSPVMRKTKNTGPSVELVTQGGGATSIAVDASGVYWAVGNTGEVKWVALAGGTPQTRATSTGNARFLVMDSNTLFWLDGTAAKIYSAPKTGGTATPICTPTSGGLGGLVIDDTSAYWTVSSDNLVEKVSKAGGVPINVADNQDGAKDIAVDETNVYWTTYVGDTIMKASKTGGTPEGLATAQDAPAALQADAESLYWIGNYNTTVQKMSKSGGKVFTLATGQSQARYLLVDDKYVYWVNNIAAGNVTFYRVPK
jgi:hypothetical protein